MSENKKPLEKSPIEKMRETETKGLSERKELALKNLEALKKGLAKFKHHKDAGIHSVHSSMLTEMWANDAKKKLHLSEGHIDMINNIHDKLKEAGKL